MVFGHPPPRGATADPGVQVGTEKIAKKACTLYTVQPCWFPNNPLTSQNFVLHGLHGNFLQFLKWILCKKRYNSIKTRGNRRHPVFSKKVKNIQYSSRGARIGLQIKSNFYVRNYD